jgi:predicted transposase/invertase (TIGR01784 family)
MIDADNLYKTVLKKYFWDGLKLFFPKLYEAANRSVAPVSLDKELDKVTYDLKGGANRVDLLMSVTLKNGHDEILLCHLEVQGKSKRGDDLPLRMFKYMTAIFRQNGKVPVGIVVITVPRPKKEKNAFRSDTFDVGVTYKYKNFSVIDTPDEILLCGDNRIGLVLYAAKCAYKSGKDEAEKFRYLRHISDLWNERGWNAEEKRDILEAVEYLIHLTDEDYKRQIVEHVENLKMSREDREMYKSIFEEVYTERGRQEGETKARVEMAKNLLAEGISPDIIERTSGLSQNDIDSLITN